MFISRLPFDVPYRTPRGQATRRSTRQQTATAAENSPPGCSRPPCRVTTVELVCPTKPSPPIIVQVLQVLPHMERKGEYFSATATEHKIRSLFCGWSNVSNAPASTLHPDTRQTTPCVFSAGMPATFMVGPAPRFLARRGCRKRGPNLSIQTFVVKPLAF